MNFDNFLCSIYNDKFLIYLNDRIEFEEYDKLLLECVQNPDYNGPKNSISLIDVYEYLKNTHFLGFVVSKIFLKEIWWSETIDMQIQIVEESSENYSKIMILIETNHCPDNLFDLTATDRDQTKWFGVNKLIPGIPIVERVLKNKSMHSPIIEYDISLGFNNSSRINFNNIHIGNLYNSIISKYIEDALDTFYPERRYISQITELNINEKLIRVTFEVVTEDNLMSIKMICTPAVYFAKSNQDLYKYHFAGNEYHLISLEPINQKLQLSNNDDFCSFLDNISSSDSSQVMTFYTMDAGDISKCYELYNVTKSHDIIFTPHRTIANHDRFRKNQNINAGKTRYFPQFKIEYSSYASIINYWCSLEDIVISIDPDASQHIKIHGFINLDSDKLGDMSFNDIYQIIENEIEHYFDLTRKEYEQERFDVICCYRSKNIVRLILTSSIDNSNNVDMIEHTTQKKKFKLFGRE